MQLSYDKVKRLLDWLAAAVGLAVLSPVMLLTAFGIQLSIGNPVLFRQVRPGMHGKPFEMLKFRTMTDARDAAGALLPDAERLTRVGRALRASSLDEVPELINVLRGDMSLVGPRPLLLDYLELYSPKQARRHEVRPGITGWAQVNGRNAITWEQKFELDVWYVDNRSLPLDLYILLVTVVRVLRSDGITQPGLATVDRFPGSSPDRAKLQGDE